MLQPPARPERQGTLDRTVQPNGQKIKDRRKARKWSQQDLAEEVVCSKRTVENAEAGKRVRESVLNDIATALGVAVSGLICNDPPTDEEGAVNGPIEGVV